MLETILFISAFLFPVLMFVPVAHPKPTRFLIGMIMSSISLGIKIAQYVAVGATLGNFLGIVYFTMAIIVFFMVQRKIE